MSAERSRRARIARVLQEWDSEDLHAVAGRFNRDRQHEDLTEPQEWLYDKIIAELEWRRSDAILTGKRRACTCWLCFSPFPESDRD